MIPRRHRAGSWARKGALPLCIAACAVLLLSGAFLPAPHGSLRHTLAWAWIVCTGLWAWSRQLRLALGRPPPVPALAVGGEAGFILGIAALALIQLTGGARSPLEPLLYLLAAGYVLAFPLPLAVLLVAAILGLDAALLLAAPPALSPSLSLRERWPTLVSHAGFAVLFGSLYHALLGTRLRAAGRAEKEAVRRRIADAEERARELRLVATAAEDPGSAEKRVLSAVSEVEAALRETLAAAEAALSPDTVAVFLLSTDGGTVRLRECRSAADRVVPGPLPSGEGALGAVLTAGRSLRLAGDGPPLTHLAGSPRAAFCGAPLRAEGPRSPERPVLGAIVADRAQPFSATDERVLCALADQAVRAVASERLLVAVRKEKEEKARFFQALEDLNRTTSVLQAAETTVAHARRMCPELDLCAVTLVEERSAHSRPPSRRDAPLPRRPRHRVVAAAGDNIDALRGLVFVENAGLVSNVVRLGAPLPGRPLGSMDRVLIFDTGTAVRGLAGLKIFPLRAGAAALGTLVCGSRKNDAPSTGAQRELSMLALQAAEALARTRLYEQAERLATTDGLTGLLNRRTLEVQLSARLREARRYLRPVSFLLLDIDHFKNVNDTHGHPAGDAVLQGVASVAQAQARETDLVARYGGEELALLLPETDATGARAIAERLCAAVAGAAHAIEGAVVRCTVSVGVATWPACGDGETALVEAADKALYRAKQGGRNRVESDPGRAAA